MTYKSYRKKSGQLLWLRRTIYASMRDSSRKLW